MVFNAISTSVCVIDVLRLCSCTTGKFDKEALTECLAALDIPYRETLQAHGHALEVPPGWAHFVINVEVRRLL